MTNSNTVSDDSLIRQGIEQGGKQRRLFEDRLYKKYAYLISNGVWKHKITEDESSMAYSDTILTVINHLINKKFEGRAELKTYIHQIFSNKCVDIIRKNTTKKSTVYQTDIISDHVNQLPDDLQNQIQQLITQETTQLIWQQVQNLGNKCYSLLLHWHEGYTDQEVADIMEFNSADVVKTSRLRCITKLRTLFKSQP